MQEWVAPVIDSTTAPLRLSPDSCNSLLAVPCPYILALAHEHDPDTRMRLTKSALSDAQSGFLLLDWFLIGLRRANQHFRAL